MDWLVNSHRLVTCSLTALSLVAGSSAVAAQTVPPGFTASPFSPEFVIVGTQEGVGVQYVPANGDGTFGAPTDVPVLSRVLGVDVADSDGDGDLDFLAADGLSGAVYLYKNPGDGTFAPRRVAVVNVTVFGTTRPRIADFNDDGRPDLVIGHAFVTAESEVLLQIRPDGSDGAIVSTWNGMTARATPGATTVRYRSGIAVGDIDGDDHSDIVLLGEEGEGGGEVRLYRGNGKGRFGDPDLLFDIEDAFGVNLHATALAAFDLEGDGDLDLAVGDGCGSHPDRRQQWQRAGSVRRPPGGLRGGPKRDRCLRRRRRRRSRPG